jgi:hypothetical protein
MKIAYSKDDNIMYKFNNLIETLSVDISEIEMCENILIDTIINNESYWSPDPMNILLEDNLIYSYKDHIITLIQTLSAEYQHCYLMGYDVNSDSIIAIEFELNPGSVNDESNYDNFILGNLKVSNIFDENKKSYQRIKIFPFFEGNINTIIRNLYFTMINSDDPELNKLQSIMYP